MCFPARPPIKSYFDKNFALNSNKILDEAIYILFIKIISDLFLVDYYLQTPPPAWQSQSLLLGKDDSRGSSLVHLVPGQLAREPQHVDLHHRLGPDTAQLLHGPHWVPLGEQGVYSFTLLSSSPQTELGFH